MTPRIVADRAVEVTDRRELRLYECGRLVEAHVFACDRTLWDTAREWLTFRVRQERRAA